MLIPVAGHLPGAPSLQIRQIQMLEVGNLRPLGFKFDR